MAAARRHLITLLSDFGDQDGYVGVLKGVILGLNPEAVLVDLSHQVPPRDILAGAFILQGAVPYFPPGTVHLAVVDPGVGTDRRPLALYSRGHFFVGPDNGLFHLALGGDRHFQAVRLDNPAYFLPQVSATFHGRDLFAPVAAHLSRGVPLADLGPPLADPLPLALPALQVATDVLTGQIIHLDRFGNLISNIPGDTLFSWAAGRPLAIRVAGGHRVQLVRTYGDAASGELVALVGSHGYVEIACAQGSAADRLPGGLGLQVAVSVAA